MNFPEDKNKTYFRKFDPQIKGGVHSFRMNSSHPDDLFRDASQLKNTSSY